MDRVAQQDRAYIASRCERERYENIWAFFTKKQMDQERPHHAIERTIRRYCQNFEKQGKRLYPVEQITPSVSLNHSSSRNGGDSRSRSNSSRKDKTGSHLPTGGMGGARRSVFFFLLSFAHER